MTSESTLERFSSSRVRRDFLDFFVKEAAHKEVPSAPVFPQDDPTLLFTNAGMNQFKDVFLGTGSRPYKRAVDTQKCIRVSGKHNDLEEVGRDTYHHTFFEMLGNWSLGDYFKEDAIVWAWKLLTEVWKLPTDRLWVTVFEGNKSDGLSADGEAERLWIEKAGVDPSRVLRCNKEDNFWEMGDSGPCGPCTEIHIDRGGPDSDPADGADPKIGVNAGNERFIELWNLVFIQFNRLEDGTLKDLPAQHVDTGMGFERVLSVLQGKSSNYDTDLFTPIFARLAELTGKAYEAGDERVDVAFRVIADHLRAVTAAFADGALPSNTGRGYVLRRLIRRAARFGRQDLGMEAPFLFEVAPVVAEVLGEVFPEMRERIDHVQLLIREEEISFGRTLGRGLVRFEDLAKSIESKGASLLPGDEAYELYATFGFPQDLVELMAEERGLALDAAGWSKAQAAHQEASKSEGKFKQLLSAEDLEGLPATESTYHSADLSERTECTANAVQLFGEGDTARLVLDKSPFYAESGGQAGDRGVIEGSGWRFRVEETRKIGDVVVHVGELEGAFRPGPAEARVDRVKRGRTARNHTATHLLHKALKDVLGDHVNQQGSYVGPDRLRFDFSNPKGVEPEDLERIEAIVNEQVIANASVQTTVENLAAAKERGVTALFGEKYDDEVRVVDVGGWSTELCGGTHVRAAGDIGPFVILSERAIQAGVRRIEAVTGGSAIIEMQRQRRLLSTAAQTIKATPGELSERIVAMQAKLKEAKKSQKASSAGAIDEAFNQLKAAFAEAGGVQWAALDLPELAGKDLRDLGDRAKSLGEVAVALFGREGDGLPFQIICTEAAQKAGLEAGALAKELGGLVGGGGGGRPDAAQGRGQCVDAVPQALEFLRSALPERLG